MGAGCSVYVPYKCGGWRRRHTMGNFGCGQPRNGDGAGFVYSI